MLGISCWIYLVVKVDGCAAFDECWAGSKSQASSAVQVSAVGEHGASLSAVGTADWLVSSGKPLIGMPKLSYRIRHEQPKRLTRSWTAVQEAKARETAE